MVKHQSIAILFEIGLQAAPENALKRCIFRLASAHFKSKRLYNVVYAVSTGYSFFTCE